MEGSTIFDYETFMREDPHREVNPEMEEWLINHLLEKQAFDVVSARKGYMRNVTPRPPMRIEKS